MLQREMSMLLESLYKTASRTLGSHSIAVLDIYLPKKGANNQAF